MKTQKKTRRNISTNSPRKMSMTIISRKRLKFCIRLITPLKFSENNKFRKRSPCQARKIDRRKCGSYRSAARDFVLRARNRRRKSGRIEARDPDGSESREYEKRRRTDRLGALRDGNRKKGIREKNNRRSLETDSRI